ncbi:MAG: hypothetical protein H6823_10895 [Planctomycetaceae bacterium]|nr:hypothetical protein [Planctomycetales bacterium]MCB9938740.1 hypothetical protein [Planctomycetaceae bacterium]
MSETQEKLNWLAFRYVANELDAIEASEFELRLMTDQTAREAIAVAVGETTRIRVALGDAAVVAAASQRTSWGQKSTRFAIVAMGSCLTLLLAVALLRPSVSPTGIASQSSVNEPIDSRAELAFAWAEVRYQLAEFQPAANAVMADAMDPIAIALRDSESEQSLVAPNWMLAALAKKDSGIELEFEIQE